jgi:hypothetical protein
LADAEVSAMAEKTGLTEKKCQGIIENAKKFRSGEVVKDSASEEDED